jgi:hypothetical protein
MEEFPADFNGNELLKKISANAIIGTFVTEYTEKIIKCLSKYRERIYNIFVKNQTGILRIQLEDDYTSYVHNLLVDELHKLKLSAKTVFEEETFIHGGENDPEDQTCLVRYLVITPGLNKKNEF